MFGNTHVGSSINGRFPCVCRTAFRYTSQLLMTYVYSDDMFPHLLCSCIVMLPVRTDAREHVAFSYIHTLPVCNGICGGQGVRASYLASLPLPDLLLSNGGFTLKICLTVYRTLKEMTCHPMQSTMMI